MSLIGANRDCSVWWFKECATLGGGGRVFRTTIKASGGGGGCVGVSCYLGMCW